MNRKIKVIFTVLIFAVLILVQNNINAKGLFGERDRTTDSYGVEKATDDFNYEKWGSSKGVDSIQFNVIGRSNNVVWEAKKEKSEDGNKDRYIEIKRTNFNESCYIDIELNETVVGYGMFYSNQDAYIGDSTSIKNKALDSHRVCYRNKGDTIQLKDFKVELLDYSKYSMRASDAYFDHFADNAKIRIYLHANTNGEIHLSDSFNIYIRGYNENILIAKFVDSTETVFKSTYNTSNMLFSNCNSTTIRDNEFNKYTTNGWEHVKDKVTDTGWIKHDDRKDTKVEKGFGDKLYYRGFTSEEATAIGADRNIKMYTEDGVYDVTLKAGCKYKITTHFFYMPHLHKLYGLVAYNQIEDARGEEVNDERGQAAEDSVTDSGDKLAQALKIADKNLGEGREYNEFTGVLDHIDYYSPDTNNITNEDVIEITTKASKILSIITSLGMVIAVLMSAILGIKYMLGSVEEKADYKKGMIPYFVGAILLFGICTIVKVMQQLGESINNI